MTIRRTALIGAIPIALAASLALAADVKNLRTGQEGKRAFVQFDLVGKPGEKEAGVTVSIDVGGEKYTSDKLSLSGDFGTSVKVGRGRRIWWDLLKDMPAGHEGEIEWELLTTPSASSLAVLKAMQERADRERAAQEKLARDKAEQERLAREEAERRRLAQEKAKQEKAAQEKLEKERLAREEAERQRVAREKAEQEKVARDKAEQERLALKKAEQEKLAREEAERLRIAREQLEQERLAKEKAEKERLARDEAERQRVAREKAEQSARQRNALTVPGGQQAAGTTAVQSPGASAGLVLAEQTITDTVHKLMWMRTPSARKYSWYNTDTYLAKVNESAVAGFSDWRIPTAREFTTLASQARSAGYGDSEGQQVYHYANRIGFKNILPERYWTSESRSYGAGTTLTVFKFWNGYFDEVTPSQAKMFEFTNYLVLVRDLKESDRKTAARSKAAEPVRGAGDKLSESDAYLVTELTVVDKASGLTWKRDGGLPEQVSFRKALAYAEKLNAELFGGYNDWRLPVETELKTLVANARKSNGKNDPVKQVADQLNSIGFTGIKAEYYWAFHSYLFGMYSKICYADMEKGNTYTDDISANKYDDVRYYTLLVRGGSR